MTRASFLLRPFHPPVSVPAAHIRFLLLIALAYLVEQYDINMLSLALPQIQLGLGIGDDEIGMFLALPRLGVIAALGLGIWADRAGRRRLLLITMVGIAAASLFSALAPNKDWFIAGQILGRVFGTAEEILSVVVIAEELEAEARGWGLGIMAALGSAGSGVASLIYAGIDDLPGGWRGLYVVGVVPILALAWARRALPETRRFAAAGPRNESVTTPLRRLIRDYPGRLAIVLGLALPFYFGSAPALAFVSKFLQDRHGFVPSDVTLLYIFGGAFAFFGNIVGGRLSDQFGRRRLFVATLLIFPACLAVMYQTSSDVIAVVAWILALFTYFAADVLFSAYGAELFPTSYRSSASAARYAVISASAALGFFMESILFRRLGDHGQTITWLLAALPCAALIAWLALPETARRELEDIAPEKE